MARCLSASSNNSVSRRSNWSSFWAVLPSNVILPKRRKKMQFGFWFNIKMPSWQHRNSHWRKDNHKIKSYLHKGNLWTDKTLILHRHANNHQQINKHLNLIFQCYYSLTFHITLSSFNVREQGCGVSISPVQSLKWKKKKTSDSSSLIA